VVANARAARQTANSPSGRKAASLHLAERASRNSRKLAPIDGRAPTPLLGEKPARAHQGSLIFDEEDEYLVRPPSHMATAISQAPFADG
jgi:hypothetical protein